MDRWTANRPSQLKIADHRHPSSPLVARRAQTAVRTVRTNRQATRGVGSSPDSPYRARRGDELLRLLRAERLPWAKNTRTGAQL